MTTASRRQQVGDDTWPPPGRPRPKRTAAGRAPKVPRGLAPFMRPVLPALTTDIANEIQRRIADYGPHSGEVYLTSTRLAITQAVQYFVDHLEDPSAPRTDLDDTLHRIGRGEAYEGRTLEALRASFQIGAGMAWRRIHALALSQGLPSQVLGDLGDELFVFMDSLAEEAARGYRDAQEQLSDAAHQWRGRVLELILAGSAAPAGELAAHAAAGNWAVPESVAMIAVRRNPDLALPSARMLHPSTLATLHVEEPMALYPAPVTGQMCSELAVLFAGHRIAVGCTVPLAEASSSLRWARRALDLAERGLIDDAPVLDCTEHLGSLWIHAEPLLADLVRTTVLAPLLAEPPNSRRILAETLLAWIETSCGSAPLLATVLDRHPQTVRYRLKRLRELFGDTLDVPQRRLEMYFALKATPTL